MCSLLKNLCTSKCIYCLSTVLFLLAVVCILIGITVSTGATWMNDLMPEGGTEEDQQFAANAASFGTLFEVGLYIFGIYMLVIGVTGCICTKKYRAVCLCVCAHQIFTLGLIAVTIFLATIPFTIWWVSEDDIDWYCDQSKDELTNYYIENDVYASDFLLLGKDYIIDADTTMTDRDEQMCTITCPCDVENFDAWVDLKGDEFDASRYFANGTVDDWEDCAAIVATTQDSVYATYFDSLLKVLEEDFECQGLCTTGNFWLFQDVSDGPVEDSCLLKMKQDFSGSSFWAAIVLFITVMVDIFLFISMFSVYKKGADL